jgi:predicted transposase YbfD/YdcC
MQAVLEIFRAVRDPRDFNARHDCSSMLMIALLAQLCGAQTCVDIADFGAAHEDVLSEVIDLPYGAPSHDTFSRLFRLLDPDELTKALSAFAKLLRDGLGLTPGKGVIAVDGKTLRRGYERGRSCMAPLMVSVWDGETHLSLGGLAAENGNEVAAVIKALQSIDLKGGTVTADALHCHPKMAETILERGGEYALKLKANNKPLHDKAVAAFKALDNKGKAIYHETNDKAHDRFEHRRGCVVAAPKDANLPGIAMFGRIESERRCVNGKTQSWVHYVALSERLTPQEMMEVTRAHWAIENKLHWQLDVVFREDEARSRKRHAAANLAFLRRMARDMLASHPEKVSLKRKMNRAAWSKEFLYNLFAYMQ